MEKNKSSSLADITVTYGVAVVSVIIAFALGAYSIAAAIAMFTDNSADLPSIFNLLGSGGVTSTVASAAVAVFAGVIAHLAMGRIATSKSAGALVASDNYQLINKFARAFCFITAGAALACAVAVLLGALLSISDYTPWGAYLLGETVPLLFVAGGLCGAAIMLDKFVKAAIKPNMLAMVGLIIAIAGMVLVCIAILVTTHVSDTPSGSYRSIYNSILH